MSNATMILERLDEINSDCEYAYYHDGVVGSLMVMSDTGDTLLPPHEGRWNVLECVTSREDAVEAARAWEAAR